MSNRQRSAETAPGRYQARQHRRWRVRLVTAAVALGGLLGLWEIVAHVPTAPARATPTLPNAEQQLQISGGNSAQDWFSPQGAPRPPDVTSGTS